MHIASTIAWFTASPDISWIAVARSRRWACNLATAGCWFRRRTWTVRRRGRHPRTPGRAAISVIAASDPWNIRASPSNLISVVVVSASRTSGLVISKTRTKKAQLELLKIPTCELCKIELCKSLAPVIFWTSSQMHCFCSQTCGDKWLQSPPAGLAMKVVLEWVLRIVIIAAYIVSTTSWVAGLNEEKALGVDRRVRTTH